MDQNRTDENLKDGDYVAPNIARAILEKAGVYRMGTFTGALQGNPGDFTTALEGNILKTDVFITRVNQTVTNALVVGKKLNIADIGDQNFLMSVRDIQLTIAADAPEWDGGDIEFFLGDFSIGKITAANLATGVNGAKVINLNIPAIQIGSGTFIGGEVDITYPTLISMRLSAPTTNFVGLVGVAITIASYRTDCGTWCSDCVNLTKGIKCVSGKCTLCSGTSFESGDVVNI